MSQPTQAGTALAAKMKNGSISTKHLKKQDYPKSAQLSLTEAIQVATQQIPGKATQAQLESDGGYLVYTITIASGSELKDFREVKVDAGSRTILEVEQKGSLG